MRSPPLLQAGARVALVAPSGPLRDAGDLDRAMSNVRELGWEPVPGKHVLERDGYLAGTDAHRLADFNRLSADDSIDAVWCIRGGYGAARLLEGIDYEAWLVRPKALIGYSDITALHSAIGARTQLITFHGPTARGILTEFTRESFRRVVTESGPYEITHEAIARVVGGRARGRLTGGNLALVASLVGTPYAVNLDGAILVLEDISEAVYRIDRMLTQLWLSGGLRRVAGIAFGRFTEIPEDDAYAGHSLEKILTDFARRAGVPCVMNFPIGHVPDHVTLALGATAELDADSGVLRIFR